MIRILPQNLINQIAAGEVIERPASIVKELVENSIDAQATSIEIKIEDGGKSSIIVSDNGVGMERSDLELSIKRHATSKLADDDLFNISTMGFRGEAMSSIASVSRLSISSSQKDSNEAWMLKINNGDIQEISPIAMIKGTKIEVRDIFYSIPARLKFLKTPAVEQNYILDVVKRLALANPKVKISVFSGKRKLLSADVENKALNITDPKECFRELLKDRIGEIIDPAFMENSLFIDTDENNIKIYGFCSLPTYNRGDTRGQYFFVNGRPLKDKQLFGALKAAYRDLIANDRYPWVVLFFDVERRSVDMNVHPAKTEIRFRYAYQVRQLLIKNIKEAMAVKGLSPSSSWGSYAFEKMKTNLEKQLNNTIVDQDGVVYETQEAYEQREDNSEAKNSNYFERQEQKPRFNFNNDTSSSRKYFSTKQGVDNSLNREILSQDEAGFNSNYSVKMHDSNIDEEQIFLDNKEEYPLGVARTQLYKTYIVSQSDENIYIIDQHAAHERIVYERLKKSFYDSKVEGQLLLVPAVCDLNAEELEAVCAYKKELYDLGVDLDKFGENAVLVRQMPAILGDINTQSFIRDLAVDLLEYESVDSLEEKLMEIVGRIACHGSIRAGRELSTEEMNNLLRAIENTHNSAQCKHGRPTYVRLGLNDIKNLFGR